MRLKPNFILFALALFAIQMMSNCSAQDWTQWRGPERTGVIENEVLAGAESLEGLEKGWHIDLGPSYSGPIVAGDKVFVTETKDKRSEVIRCLNRADGTEVWATEWVSAMTVPFFAKANGDWIRATPIYDDGRLYVLGMCDVLACLNAETGEEIWKRDFVKEITGKNPSFGAVCSPLIRGDHLYIQAGNGFHKINKSDGKTVWTSLSGGGSMMSDGAFSSPIFATVAGRDQLLVQTRTTLAGVAPESGDVLWSQDVPHFRGMNILTPTVHNDTVFTSSYNNGSFLFNVSASGSGLTSSQQWKGRERGYMSSPIRIGDFVYMHLQNTRFACVDLNTGETKWKSKQFGKYWSMVASGDRILALDERGELLLVRANSEGFDLLDRKSVSDESTWAHIAMSDNEVFVRELNGLTVYSWPKPPAKAAGGN